jgi:hypothetical protein
MTHKMYTDTAFCGVSVEKPENVSFVCLYSELERFLATQRSDSVCCPSGRETAVTKNVSKKMAVFWVVAPCSPVEAYRRLRSACCLHRQGGSLVRLWNLAMLIWLPSEAILLSQFILVILTAYMYRRIFNDVISSVSVDMRGYCIQGPW